jgi:hypothetical protein
MSAAILNDLRAAETSAQKRAGRPRDLEPTGRLAPRMPLEPMLANMAKGDDPRARLIAFVDTHPVTHIVGCHVEISRTGQDYPYGVTYQPDEAPWQLTVAELRQAYEVAETITKPGIYFTGSVFLCNQTRATTTIDRNPYAYS